MASHPNSTSSQCLSVTGEVFHPYFHYNDICVSPTLMLKTLDRILNGHYKGTPKSFPAFYLSTLHQPGRLVTWSPHEAHQPLAVIQLQGESLQGGNYGSASVYLMHPKRPKRDIPTSFFYLFVKETIRHNKQDSPLTTLRTLTTGSGGPFDVVVTEVREYWLRADLVGNRYLIRGVKREDAPPAASCLTLKYQGVCYWVPTPNH
ncbi:hypothetical protein BDV28DRAFT_145638 [Aspergillus coremiiformis]|uniref:Uncharacterized protein n=1 Tax=Aspergillus coremiiformis TaxID=138285 RepID=A0A5N6ZEA0_9EURO|nr:hypothetical protein BDV28DRAFT_145638 [Aspergillus coremiiformis]